MELYIQIPQLKQKEGSSFTATAYFRDGEGSTTPTTAKYRVDCLTTGKELTDWTTLTPAVSIAISITAAHNAIQSDSNNTEKKQLTVAADPDLSTQVREVVAWTVENLYGTT